MRGTEYVANFRIDGELYDDPNITLWRYTSLPKFLNLVSKSALYFQRMDLFGDPYEGQVSKPTLERLEDMYKTIAESTELFDSNLELIEALRETTYLNCWRRDKYEDYGMWHAYTDPSSGLAIKTSVGRLREAITVDEDFQGQLELKQIEYIDYRQDRQDSVGEGVFFPFGFKRIQHQNEREVRLMITNYPHDRMKIDDSFTAPENPDRLRTVGVIPTELIEEVRIHPEAGSALQQAVVTLLGESATELDSQIVTQSELTEVGR